MTQRAKNLLGAVVGPYVRRLTRGSCRVLMYHRVRDGDFRGLPVAVFEQQMAYVKKNFRPMPLPELAQRLKNGDALPENSVVVTIDDGYADSCRVAAPILVRHEIPATLFVVSDFIDRKLWLWYDALRYLVHATHRDHASVNLTGRRETVSLVDRACRDSAWERIANAMFASSMEAKMWGIRELAADLAVALPEVPTPEYEAASWDELQRLDPRLFDIGGHTKSHAILSQCDPQELRIELEDSKAAIESHVGRDVRSFGYPNGQRDDYNETCVRAVRQAGYACAVVAYGGLVQPSADPYQIERFGPSAAASAFRNEMNGVRDLRGRIEAVLRR